MRVLRYTMATLAAAISLAAVAAAPAAAETAAPPGKSGAEFCFRHGDGKLTCYEDKAAAVAAEITGSGPAGTSRASGATSEVVTAPLSINDCLEGRFCFWAAADFNSAYPWHWRSASGSLSLAYSFPDVNNLITSYFNNRSGHVVLIDSSCPNETLLARPNLAIYNLSNTPRACGGTWNNKIDMIELFDS
ncbi:hypothetical protein GCM10022225_67050 [Plantactinospora mayteni]|uniref:Peptidase inhibitor family I36 n=1 Tax=Plantactinospora mayteni TaxID=566021 RepID=A0ABQ4EV09_9ACTN|nr:hypothetical protein [Plantactinospora mayteni]GIG98504.1 hypothetical protein Pma05_50770 [Plantactinospora mayteni]